MVLKRLAIVLCALFGLLMILWASRTNAQTQGFLADRHATRNVTCQGCHGAQEPTLTSMKDSCLACHGSYAELAQRTAGGPVNPHKSHLGEPYCTFCHHGHEKSVNGCAGGQAAYCHGSSVLFQFDVP
jgi:fumarate reductase flavoprotein subunit